MKLPTKNIHKSPSLYFSWNAFSFDDDFAMYSDVAAAVVAAKAGHCLTQIIGISNVLVVVEMLDSAVIESEFDMTGIRVTEVVVHGYLVFAAVGFND